MKRLGSWTLASWAIAAPTALFAQAPASGENQAEAAASAKVERIEVVDRIEADGSTTRRERSVVLLRDAAAVAQYSQIGVPFLEETQKAEITRLVVIKPDGTELDLAASAPRNVAPVLPAELPIYSDLRMLRAAVPSLQPGDRIDFEMRVTAEPLVPGEVWVEASFGESDRSDLLTYELDLPDDMDVTVHVRPQLDAELEESTVDGRHVRRWRRVGAGPEGAKSEEAPAAEEGIEPDVSVTSFESWDELARWWAGLAPPELDEVVRAKARELTAGIESPRARLSALHRFVAQEIRYLTLPLGLGRYRARPATEVLGTGLGDCKDKIRLLSSLAAAIGIPVDPVLVPVQRRRRVDEAPSPLPFDHVLARVRLEGEEIWIDATSEMTPMGSLPRLVRGLPGVAAVGPPAETRAELVTTPERLPHRTSQTVESTGAIDLSGLLHAAVRWTFSGDDELIRIAFRYATPDQRRQMVEFLGRDWTRKGKVGEFTAGEPREVDAPFWIEYGTEWQRKPTVWAKSWSLQIPVPRIELDEPPDAEEDPDAARRPLELTSTERQKVVARIEVPEGVRVEAPVPVTAKRDFADFHSDYRIEGRTLVLERELEIRTMEVPPEKFAELRALVDLIAEDRKQKFDLAAAPALVPEDAESADELTSLCYEATQEERYDEAERLCRRAVELEPEHHKAWNRLGFVLSNQGRNDEAEAAFRRQIEVDPQNIWAWAGLGLVARDRGDDEEAERLLRRQIEIAPLEAYAYQHLGSLLIDQSRFEEAETILQRAQKLDPDDDWTRRRLLVVHAALGRCDAIGELARGIPAASDAWPRRAAIALALLHSECHPLAPFASWFEQLRADAEKELAEMRLTLEVVSKRRSKAATAVVALTSAWDGLGRIALERGSAAEADRWLGFALGFAPSPSTAASRAEALEALGDHEGAKLHWAIAVALDTGIDASSVEAARARLERDVPDAAERSRLELRAREASWRLRSVTSTVPAAAGEQGEIWMQFTADGVLEYTIVDVELTTPALMNALGVRLETELPKGNRARIFRRATYSCDAEGECTFLFEYPFRTAGDLLAGE